MASQGSRGEGCTLSMMLVGISPAQESNESQHPNVYDGILVMPFRDVDIRHRRNAVKDALAAGELPATGRRIIMT